THRDELASDDVTLVEGLPATTVARTISDLVADSHDMEHVAQIVRQALWEERTTLDELSRTLRQQHGGYADKLLNDLVHTAGLDPEQLLRNLLQTPAVDAAVSAAALKRFADIVRLALPDDIGQEAVREALAPLRD